MEQSNVLTMRLRMLRSKMLPRIGVALSLLTILLVPVEAVTAAYCDRVRSGDLSDASLLLCEDFEAPTLTRDTGFGNDGPYFGPWYDDTGYPGARGNNSYWTRTYGSAGSGYWRQGEPSSAKLGRPCAFPACFLAAWDPTDLWQGNSVAGVAILQNGQFNAEVPSVGVGPSNVSGGGNGVFQGNASLAHRILAGYPNTQGLPGEKSFGRAVRTFGATMAIAYPSSSASSGIWSGPWKHNEWRAVSQDSLDGLLTFHNDSTLKDTISPFTHFMFFHGETQAGCKAKIAAATINAGQLFCSDVHIQFQPTTAVFTRTMDWPYGTWGCVRGHYENMGLSNARVRVWFTGPAGVEKLLVDFTMDQRLLSSKGGYKGFAWNAYSNHNQEPGGTTQVTFRYEDNVHIREGAPVSCAQIGFGSSGQVSSPAPSSAPSPPTGLTIK
jgi:hypothetical protein